MKRKKLCSEILTGSAAALVLLLFLPPVCTAEGWQRSDLIEGGGVANDFALVYHDE
jgi:hypothetical protein